MNYTSTRSCTEMPLIKLIGWICNSRQCCSWPRTHWSFGNNGRMHIHSPLGNTRRLLSGKLPSPTNSQMGTLMQCSLIGGSSRYVDGLMQGSSWERHPMPDKSRSAGIQKNLGDTNWDITGVTTAENQHLPHGEQQMRSEDSGAMTRKHGSLRWNQPLRLLKMQSQT